MKNAWKILGGCGCLSMIAGAALVAASFFLVKPDLARYQNSREGRTGNLLENYVDFSFDYPKPWSIQTTDPDNINFVTIERTVDEKTYENLNVGYFRPAATDAENQAVYRQVLAQIEGQFSQQFRDFRKVREGPATVGEYSGHEALYDGNVQVDGKRVDVFVRAIFLIAPGGQKGVSMMMIGTTLNPDLKEADDLGTEGELPIVLKSFRFL